MLCILYVQVLVYSGLARYNTR